MSDAERNKLAAQIIKAEMLGDSETVSRLKTKLANSPDVHKPQPQQIKVNRYVSSTSHTSTSHTRDTTRYSNSSASSSSKVKKFLNSTGSLNQLFVQEKNLSESDEARMFLKTAAKFSRDDMETKHFSEEIDDSQLILNKTKRHKPATMQSSSKEQSQIEDHKELDICDRCLERQSKHLIVDQMDNVYLSLLDAKPFLSSMSNCVIRNKDHLYDCFVASSDHQNEVEKLILTLREAWKSKGYHCLTFETYFKNRKNRHREFVSCNGHFQIYCLPIKEKHYEKVRMHFKQAIQNCGGDWSMNRKLIVTDGRRIQRYLPKNLSYFWVCFDELNNGYGHIIESEQEFSRYFGLEVLSGLLDKDFNPMKLDQKEEFQIQFERCRDFKLLYSKFKS